MPTFRVPPPPFRPGISRRAVLAAVGGLAFAPRFAASLPLRQGATPVPDGGTPVPPEREAGGTLVVGALTEPATLHPWFADGAGFDVLEGVVEGLLRYNADGRLQPALADDFAIASDDMTYAFTLRDDVRFHDGTVLTSADVVASWQGQREAGIAGQGSLAWAKIASIDAPDPRTVVVRTSEPYAPFLSTVAVAPVLPADLLAGGADAAARLATDPVGTGPFRVERWEPGRAIELVRFDGHWGGPALLDRVEVRFTPDAGSILRGLESGEVHLSGGALGLPAGEGQAAAGIPGVVVQQHPTPNWLHLDLKQVGFLRERAVRQALNFATPREAIVADILGGRAIPAFADQMPGSWAFHPTLQPRPFDPEQAAELLAEAGFRPGRDGVLARGGVPFRLELWGVAGDPQAEAMLTAIATAWSELGILLRLRFAEPEQLWGPLGYQFSDAMTACLFAWTNGNDPDDLFYWHSSQIPTSPTAPGGNLPAFFNPFAFQEEIDALTARGASTLDLDERRDVYHQVQELLAREVPVIFLAWEKAYPASRDEVGGFRPSPWTGLLWNAGAWTIGGKPAPASATPGATPIPG